ncbi:MAG: hypothetical protein R2827_08540 [Bdellovibrionales bacterium]
MPALSVEQKDRNEFDQSYQVKDFIKADEESSDAELKKKCKTYRMG